MGKPNVLVVGQYTNNRGDEAQGVALAYTVRKLIPEVNIQFIYFQPKFPVHDPSDFIENIFINAKRSIFESIFCYLRRKKHPLLDLIKGADIITMPPGGPYIGDFYPVRNEFFRAVILYFAKKYNKKTMIYAPSMGPFKDWRRKILHRFILNRADTICVRDRISHKWANELMNGRKKIHLTADAAIQKILNPEEIQAQISLTNIPLPEDHLKVGITPIDLTWHPVFGQREDAADFNSGIIRAFGKVIRQLIMKENAVIYFYPQLFGMSEDLSVINKIMEEAGKGMENDFSDRMIVLDNTRNADYQQAHISKMDCFIGTRYHSIVFSAMYTVPFISLYYEHKTEDISKRLGMGDNCIPIEQIDADRILEMLTNLNKNKKEIVDTLSRTLKEIRNSALETADLLYELYNKDC